MKKTLNLSKKSKKRRMSRPLVRAIRKSLPRMMTMRMNRRIMTKKRKRLSSS